MRTAVVPAYLQDARLERAGVQLPSHWNPKDHCSLVDVSHQGMRLAYNGQGKSDSEAASARANHPAPPQCGVFYYEVDIISKGRDGYIGVGLCAAGVSLQRLPGWEPNSWGYHGDDGCIFSGSGSGKAFGPGFTTGDVVGCGINFVTKEIFYTKNGVYVGVAFKDVAFGSNSIYPCVGLRTPGEQVDANFGQRDWKFDIVQYMADAKEKAWEEIMQFEAPVDKSAVSVPLPKAQKQTNSMESLDDDASSKSKKCSFGLDTEATIISYLIDAGYSATAEAFAAHLGVDISKELLEARQRQELRSLVLAGKIDEAVQKTFKLYGDIFASNKMVAFRLKRQKFVEMIADSLDQLASVDAMQDFQKIEGALRYGQELQDEYRDDDNLDIQQMLTETFSLLAYANPADSAVSYLLDKSHRESVASDLNGAILSAQGRTRTSALEAIIAQSVVVMDELKARGSGLAALVNVEKDCLA